MIGGCYLQNAGYEHIGRNAVTSTSSSRTSVRRFGGSRKFGRLSLDLLSGPAELASIGPDAMHDDGKLARNSNDCPP